MAMTTDEALAQLKRFLPPHYEALDPILAGIAAQVALADQAIDDMVSAVTIGGAGQEWLELLARGYGVERTTGESDASLRIRLRNVEDRVTGAAIASVVDDILAEWGASTACRVADWWEDDLSAFAGAVGGTYAETDSYCDEATTGDLWLVFVVIVPMIGGHPGHGAYCDIDDDENYVDIDAYAGDDDILSTAYDTIIDEVNRVRAAGVRWWLIVDWAGEYL